MDGPLGISPAMLSDQATQNDLVRRKLEMDSLRKRLGDVKSKEEKLRESCEGFEAIFLQKMWEQMRKTVPKEGYLHSKDEEMYQSLFDVELCKKMAGAGGIGLADMLYEQLSQQLVNSGRTTTPGSYRKPLEIAPAGLAAPQADAEAAKATAVKEAPADKKLTAENLYTPAPSQAEAPQEEHPGQSVEAALHDLKAALGKAPKGDAGAAAREWAQARDIATGAAIAGQNGPAQDAAALEKPLQPGSEAEKSQKPGLKAPAQAGPGQTPGTPPPIQAEQTPAKGAAEPGGNAAAPAGASQKSSPAAAEAAKAAEQGEAATQAQAQRLFGRRKKRDKSAKAEGAAKSSAPARSMAPEGALWPLAGEGGSVTSRFGWEDDKSGGRRRWNSGVRIAAPGQSPVRAVLDGSVVYVGQREGFGHTVVVEHKDGFRSYYSNLEDAAVRVGDKVTRGAEFAKTAMSAPSQAKGENSASLYFELKKGEMALNPESAIERPGA